MNKGNETQQARSKDVFITRVFDAPRARVWQAWTDPELFKRWWGPKGFTAPVVRIEPRVGGRFFGGMRSPEGQDFYSTGVYREVEEPARLVMTDSFADKDGNVVPATHYGFGADFPREMVVTVTFEERDGKTTMTLWHGGSGVLPDKDRADMTQGWNESFDKLAAALAAP